MGGACGTHGRDEKCIQYSGWKIWGRRYHLKDLGVDRRIILKWVLEK